MEEKIKSTISNIFRIYGSDKSFIAPFQQDRILTRCMNEISSYPNLEKELDDNKKIRYFIMQMILDDLKTEAVERI